MATSHGDGGFSLIELLLVIVILGMLATIVMYTVGGISAETEGAPCLDLPCLGGGLRRAW